MEIDIAVDKTKYDECNALVLPSNRAEKEVKIVKQVKKEVILSKKKRKKLEKIIERKNRKLNRSKILSDLQELNSQVKQNELNLMPSTSVVQTAGRKRINDLITYYKAVNSKTENQKQRDDDVDVRKIKMPRVRMKINEKNFNRNDPNILSWNDSSSSEASDDEDEEEEEEKEKEVVEEENNNNNGEEKVEMEEGRKFEENSDKIELKESSSIRKLRSQTWKVEEMKRDDSLKSQSPKAEIKKTVFVAVNRSEEIQTARLKLPILAEEHRIMEAIMYNSVVIICGETGSGKTTQLPQFLYEAGYTMDGKQIGITEPRRVAAIAMSKRVGYELNLGCDQVSYQIRFEGNAGKDTKIKFMTDGILLKELQNDFLLQKYSALIIDEAHERSLYSDILIGFLSRLVKIREKRAIPLKLIIMSATLRVEDFTQNSRLFQNPPPVIKVESRQFPVSCHFSKRTNPNYVKEAFKKVCKIHSTMPAGGILVFVTGRQEVKALVKMLREKFPLNKDMLQGIGSDKNEDENKKRRKIYRRRDGEDEEVERKADDKIEDQNEEENDLPAKMINLDQYSVLPTDKDKNEVDFDEDESDGEEKDENFNDDEDEDEFDDEDGFETTTNEPLYCLPMYSMLPAHQQAMIFKPHPAGTRFCVIATNVAETSLTIPNIKYVVDSGKVKNKVYDHVTGVSTFIVEWTSKASGDQRAGRAGRTSAGHCYRLYSSAVYNDNFKLFSEPEILIKPIDDLLLQMKAIGIDNVANFPFPSPPKVETILSGEKRLVLLGALKNENMILNNKKIERTKITPLGRVMARFPVNPRYSKMLCLSSNTELLGYTIAIISALTVQEIFLNNQDKSFKKKNFLHGDLMTLLGAIGAASYENLSEKFCEHYGLRYNAMLEINKLRQQLTQQVLEICPDKKLNMNLEPPGNDQIRVLNQLFLCSFPDHVAKQIPVQTITEKDKDGNVIGLKQKTVKNCYQSMEFDEPVFISPQSSIFNETFEYVVYHDVHQSGKMYMRNVIPIQKEWLPIYASSQCKFSNPLNEPSPRYDEKDDQIKCFRTATFGPHNWAIPATQVEYPDTIEKYRYFALHLFKGEVLEWFKQYVDRLTTSPILFTKTWAIVQPKVEKIVNLFGGEMISSKKSLLTKWKTKPEFLLNEYLEWIPERDHAKIRKQWPPNVSENRS